LPYKYWDSAISYIFLGFGGEEIETKISEIWAPRWRGTKKDTSGRISYSISSISIYFEIEIKKIEKRQKDHIILE
jgi:hypothetical protein